MLSNENLKKKEQPSIEYYASHVLKKKILRKKRITP